MCPFTFAVCALRISDVMPQAQPTLRVPWSHLCSAVKANSIALSWESRFPPSQPFSQPPNIIKNFCQGAQRGILVQDTGKTLKHFSRCTINKYFLFSQSSSHLGKHFATHLLECRCLIICLIYKLVYHKITKDFSTSKGAKSLDVSIITSPEKKQVWHKGFLCDWRKKRCKKKSVSSSWRVEAISGSLISWK